MSQWLLQLFELACTAAAQSISHPRVYRSEAETGRFANRVGVGRLE